MATEGQAPTEEAKALISGVLDALDGWMDGPRWRDAQWTAEELARLCEAQNRKTPQKDEDDDA